MMHLIITVVAVFLALLLTIIGLMWSGHTGTQKAAFHAQVNSQVNELVQLRGGILADHVKHGTWPTDLSTLVDDGIISSLPKGWTTNGRKLITEGSDDQNAMVCKAINKRLNGASSAPTCDSVGDSFIGCCTE